MTIISQGHTPLLKNMSPQQQKVANMLSTCYTLAFQKGQGNPKGKPDYPEEKFPTMVLMIESILRGELPV